MTRIIAGQWRSRRLRVPRGDAVRPTGDRVREALFSMLGPLDGARVLDLFAGTGALGLEALSRGASWCVWVEQDRGVLEVLRANVAALGAEGEVRPGDALGALRRAAGRGETYDLVLLDPPYRLAGRLGPELARLLPAVLAPGARVVAEADRRAPLEIGLPADRDRRYGDTTITIHTA